MAQGEIHYNKRAYPRISVKLSVTFMVMKGSRGDKNIRDLIQKTRTGQTLDASLGGMLLAGSQDLMVGDVLTLKFNIPTKESPLTGFAKVVWINTAGVGLNFLTMKEEDKKSLDIYLKGFSPKNE